MIKDLPVQIVARADFHQARLQLAEYAQQLHGQGKPEPTVLASALLEHYLEPEDAQNIKVVESLSSQLEAAEKTLPVVNITMAARPTREQASRLAAWFRQEIAPTVLMTFHVDPAVLAGAVVRTTNYMHDLSLSTKLLKIKNPISGRLRHV